MSYVLIVIAILLVLFGLVGSIVPGIAGPPFSFLGVLAIAFVEGVNYAIWFLVLMGILGIAIFVLDYFIPVWGTKTFGGTKAGTRGSLIGLILGLLLGFFFPYGFYLALLGPFLGAYIGEKIARTPERLAWRSAIGAFLGFLAGTLVKALYAIVCIFLVIRGIFLFIIW